MIVFRRHACGEQISATPDLEIADCPNCGVELRVPRSRRDSTPGPEPRCTRLVYVLVGVFLGVYGVHNFLAGYIARGATQLSISIAGMLVALVSFAGAFAGAGRGRCDRRGVTRGVHDPSRLSRLLEKPQAAIGA